MPYYGGTMPNVEKERRFRLNDVLWSVTELHKDLLNTKLSEVELYRIHQQFTSLVGEMARALEVIASALDASKG